MTTGESLQKETTGEAIETNGGKYQLHTAANSVESMDHAQKNRSLLKKRTVGQPPDPQHKKL